jgi:hypothetical protein
MEPRKKTSPQSFARPEDVGMSPRALRAERVTPRASRLPTAAALQLALVSSMLVTSTMLGGCSAGVDDGIAADVPRRPAVRTTETVVATTTAASTAGPAVAPPIDPEPHYVKGEMAPVMPTVVATATAKPPSAASVAPVPTYVPRPLGGKPSSVMPTMGTTGKPSLGTVPCDKPGTPESS